jgi:hypothetical protein
MSFIESLRIAALPFVTRSLRGHRGRRLAVLSLVLAAITTLAGVFLALGSGELERGIREDLRLEPGRFHRERRELVVIVDDDGVYREAERERELMQERGLFAAPPGPMLPRTQQGLLLLRAAVGRGQAVDAPRAHRALYGRARALLDEIEAEVSPEFLSARTTTFDWRTGVDVELLEQTVAQRGLPRLERYASPLGGRATLGLIGMLASGLLLVLTVVFGPVLVGMAVAQESHDNTLQPIAGTALSARQIALGLLLGALAPIAIVAAPQLVLVVTAGLLGGNPVALLGLLALLVPCMFAVTMLALAVGIFAGRRRGAGAIAITLLAGSSAWLCVGLVLGYDGIGRSDATLITLLPSGGLVHLAREAFVGPARAAVPSAFAGLMLASAIASLVVGALALRAAERRVPGLFVAPLRRGEALLGSGVLSLLTLLALAQLGESEMVFAALAVMVMPMQVLLMARVPAGDAPTGSGRVDLRSLLGEFAAFVVVHGVLGVVVVGAGFLGDCLELGVIHLGWALLVAALVAIRIVAVPARLPASVWAGFGFVLAIVEFVTGTAQVLDSTGRMSLLPLWRVSPLLALCQLALLVAIPWTLVRAITRAGKGAGPGRA